MDVQTLRARGDRDLAQILLADPDVVRAIEDRERDHVPETRRYLLGTAVRLTASMAPDLHAIAEACRLRLSVEPPLELYVAPDPHFNAFSYGEEGSRLFIGLTSSLLESLSDGELAFVIGHELGHSVFRHHDVPIDLLMSDHARVRPEQAIRLFQWQRWAEISADRAGLVCAGSLDTTARAFFKLASGLRGEGIRFEIHDYLAQIGDIQEEAARARQASERPRADWFASHPFSPLRVRAAQLCAASVLCGGERTPDELEAEVQELMSLMDPSYLMDRSETGEAMRRLLFAGGVLVAAASGGIDEREVAALESFLGSGQLPSELVPAALEADLDHRVALARQHVPPLKRAQVIRDLCVIAMADGHVGEDELAVIVRIAEALDVDRIVVEQTMQAVARGLD